MMRTLAVIPARGGSKGVPRKNLRNLGGEPLIAHTIRAALGSTTLTRTIVSTDDEEIAEVSRSFGADVPFIRSEELSSDTAASVSVAINALQFCEDSENETYDIVVLLQPTTPFRSSGDIDKAVCLLVENPAAESAITVAPMGACNPHYFYRKKSQGELWEPVSGSASLERRRQDLEELFIRTGAVYAVRRSYLLHEKRLMSDESLALVMKENESINIDTEFDLFLANAILDFNKNAGRFEK